jgi:MFS transporter, DHA1 family, tetracycline resistance protein
MSGHATSQIPSAHRPLPDDGPHYPELLPLVRWRCCDDVARVVYQVAWVFFAMYRFGWDTGQVGVAMTAAALSGTAVRVFVAERVIRRRGERYAVVLGSAIGALSNLGCALAPAGWLLYPLVVAGNLGGIADVAARTWVSRLTRAHEQGAVQGAMSAIGSLAETVVPVAATGLFAWSLRVHLPGLVLLCGAAALVVGAWIAATAQPGTGNATGLR